MQGLDEAIRQVDAFIEAQMARHGTPGIALAISNREGLLYERAYGMADAIAGTPMTPRHLVAFGSIGKSFTAIALLQLHEEGWLDLHAPLVTYLPWFEVQSRYGPITIDHLLTHTSGLSGGSDFAVDQRFEAWSARAMQVAHAPGERHHYSNLGYKLLGLVLERLERKPYREIIQQRILDPLGMRDTVPVIIHELRPRMAAAHVCLYDDRPVLPRHPLVTAT
jgi:D-alanyl-D-alanine carboxypeptidase